MESYSYAYAAQLARRLVRICAERKVTVGSAESCTGGLIAKLITDVPGSSAVLAGAFVTYTNTIKTDVLGVPPEVIEQNTEVSDACARAMARCARCKLGTTLAVSTTGFAGPGGGTEKDPVGTVYLAISTPDRTRAERLSLPQTHSRAQIRTAAAARALELLIDAIG